MFSAHLVYGLGIAVSILNIFLWTQIVGSQVKQFSAVNMNINIKRLLLAFGVISLFSNTVPIWFDIYRLIHDSNPTNLFYAYVVTSYLYRTITAVFFYLIYKSPQ